MKTSAMGVFYRSLLLVALVLPAGRAFAALNVYLNAESLNSYRQELGFNQWLGYSQQVGAHRKVRVAVLDKGFEGWKSQIGISLPENTVHVDGPLPADKQTIETPHGRLMAEILTSLLWGNPSSAGYRTNLPFELSLYNVSGFTNFKAAIDRVVQDQIDIVLYSEVWELGGNSDGRGFINREVSRAINAGILWINAAGNFSGRTYSGGIALGLDSWLKLPDQNSAIEINCRPSQGADKCPARIVLTWNDFKDDTEVGTEKDLDLVLYDDLMNVKMVSQLKQVHLAGDAKPGESKYPREAISMELAAGKYFIKVKAKSKSWISKDVIRITVDGDFLNMPRSNSNETLLNPADHPRAITVGAWDSERSSRSFALAKPDLVAPSSVKDESGKEFRGSSNAAAIVAASAVILQSHYPSMTRVGFLRSVGGAQAKGEPSGSRYFSLPSVPY